MSKTIYKHEMVLTFFSYSEDEDNGTLKMLDLIVEELWDEYVEAFYVVNDPVEATEEDRTERMDERLKETE